MKKLIVIISLCFLFGACKTLEKSPIPASGTKSISTSGETPMRVELAAANKTSIAFAYKLAIKAASDYTHTFAKSVRIRISNDQWHDSKTRRIRGVILDICRDARNTSERETYNKDFEIPYTHCSDGSGFCYEQQLATLGVDVDEITAKYVSQDNVTECRQEIAVVVDDQWLVDPVNGTHNFKFDVREGQATTN